VVHQIEALGITVYLAEDIPQPGTVLADKVEAAIHRSQAFVVLITTTSIFSAYVMQEIGIAGEHGIPIIPIIKKGITSGNLACFKVWSTSNTTRPNQQRRWRRSSRDCSFLSCVRFRLG
jgi:hypothetical protein